MENIKELSDAIVKTIGYYETKGHFVNKSANPLCKLTKVVTTQNCYRCPFNVTATEASQDFGCLARRTHDVVASALNQQEDLDAELAKKTAITFYKEVLNLIQTGVHPTGDAFSYKSKTRWAYSLRAIDRTIKSLTFKK